MAGKTPRDAASSFLHPLQEAASVLGPCKITAGGRSAAPILGEEYSWALCGGSGVAVRNASKATGRRQFYAAMSWRVIEDPREGYGPYRVTTTRYDYSLTLDDKEAWAFHWHPAGRSHVTYPHIHMGAPMLGNSKLITSKDHAPTGRMSLEQAIRWVFISGGMPARADWESHLALAEAPHLLYRTWAQDLRAEAPSAEKLR